MNKALFGLGLMLVLNLNTAAQAHKKSADVGDGDAEGMPKQKRTDSKSKRSGSPRSAADTPSFPAMTNVRAVLERSLNSSRSRIGDEVVLTTSESIKQDGVVIVPKGAKLLGRVTEVNQIRKKGGPSRLALLFDRLEGHDLSAPISATIVSITNVRTAVGSADLFASDIDSTSGPTSSLTRGTSGGGLLSGVGGAGSGVVTQVTNTVGGIPNTAAQAAGDAATSVGSMVQGIQISDVVSGSAAGSATLSSQQKSLNLEKGAIFHVKLTNHPNDPE